MRTVIGSAPQDPPQQQQAAMSEIVKQRSQNSCEINTRKASHFRDLNRRAAARTKSYKRYTHQALAHARNVASDRALAPQQEDIKCTFSIRRSRLLALSTSPILCGAI